MNMWDELGMDRMTFRDHPQRSMLIRRLRGMKIFDCCELKKIKEAFKNPIRHLIKIYEEDQKKLREEIREQRNNR